MLLSSPDPLRFLLQATATFVGLLILAVFVAVIWTSAAQLVAAWRKDASSPSASGPT